MHGNSRHGSPSPSRGASADAERIAGLLEPAVAAMGMDLEDVRITSAGRRRLLRVVVDADGGVGLDDMALVSQQLSAALDRAAVMGEAPYTLEVSSPGVDRPLTQPKHWRRAAGRLVTVPLTARAGGADAGRSPATVTGRVTSADAVGVRIDADGEIREFGYSDLGPGRIQVEFAPHDGVAGASAGSSASGSADGGLDDEAGLGADEEGSDGH
jgi:ribosome maturation factor RimP